MPAPPDASSPEPDSAPARAPFRSVLVRVLFVQLVALALLALVQRTFTP